MKDHKKHLVALILFALFLPSLIVAQNPSIAKVIENTDVASLRDMGSRMQLKMQNDFEEARLKALGEGWPVYMETDDGGWMQLIKLDDKGQPVYYGSDNAMSAAIINTAVAQMAPYNLTGAGIILREWDGGNILATHEQYSGRATNLEANGLSSHATHVGGTMIGDGTGNAAAKGMAPGATLRAFGSGGDLAEMALEASAGALISNHSYSLRIGWEPSSSGCGDGSTPIWNGTTGFPNGESELFGQYGFTSQQMDQIAFAAPNYLIFRSAGNDRGQSQANGTMHYHNDCGPTTFIDNHEADGGASGFDTSKDGGTAKNVMSVGALNDDGSTTASFSGYGPTDDGRIKPDICANGVSLTSADTSSIGINTNYISYSGTSMSTPSASGSAALLQEHYNTLLAAYMRSATLKALIIHTADDLGNPGPDYSYGWGKMNTLEAVKHIDERMIDPNKIIEDGLANLDTFSIDVYATGVEPLISTLVWTDPASGVLSSGLDDVTPMLVNDLDLEIDGPYSSLAEIPNARLAAPTIFNPWVLDPNNPANNATTGDNVLDNVENVLIADPEPGFYKIRVMHKNTLGADQDFSLITSGIAACLPDLTICPEPQTYNLDANCQAATSFPDMRGLVILELGCQAILDTVTQVPVPGTEIMGVSGDTIPVIITFFDGSGAEIVLCSVDIILVDNQAPSVLCPPDQDLAANQAGCMGLIPDYTTSAVISDNCEDGVICPITVTQVPAPGTMAPLGDIVIKIIAEDCNMNADSCEFTVTVTDMAPPVITMEAMSDTVDCDGMGNEAELQAWLDMNGGATAMDDCTTGIGDDTLSWEYELLYSIDQCAGTFIREYEFTVTDTSGNEAMTNAFFVVIDTIPPMITPGLDTMLVCDQNGAGNDNALGVWIASNAGGSATDECSMVTWTNNFGDIILDGACGNLQSYPVTFYATDECGNVDSFARTFTLIDTFPPAFLNCPREDVVENIESGLCDAFVNFAPVIAGDNCSDATVTNISSVNPVTGEPYKSGDRFPIGITTLYFQAIDDCGNADTCSLKVIVNDVDTYPEIVCPIDTIYDVNDLWECGGTVNIPPVEVSDVCPDLLITTYQIIHEGDTIANGLTGPDPSFLFPIGYSTIEYCVQDHPLLLITEVSQDIDTCGGMQAPPMGLVASDDYLEITNFGPIVYNVSCLLIERDFGGIIDTFVVPDSTFLLPGEVLVLQYGVVAADDNDPDDLLFYKGDSPDLLAGDAALYRLSYDMNIIDEITMFANAEGGIIRKSIKDNNVPGDFVLADACDTLTLGMYNPDYPPAYNNIAATEIYDTVAIQSIPKHTDECSMTVSIVDDENPFCAMRVDTIVYNPTTPIPLVAVVDSCNELIINVPSADSCIVEYVGILATNMTALGNVTLTVTSPEGTDTTLTNWTGDSLEVKAFYGDKSPGDWRFHFDIIDKTTFAGFSVDDISLSITCLDTFMMNDTMFLTTAPDMPDNEVGTCDTVFSWVHPLFLDNCNAGTIEVRYESDDIAAENLPIGEELAGFGGQVAEERFYEGTTTVKYILTDTTGNVDSCSFKVIVKDLELPLLVSCPPDTTIQLAGGECRVVYEYEPEFIDNCGIDTIYGIPPSGSEFEIGITEVKVYAVDINGNIDSTSCSFEVEVLEYLPDTINMACVENVNLSLGGDCMAVLTADIILKGTEYRCYENYCMEVKDENGNVVFSGLLSEAQHVFTIEDQNKVFTVSIIDCLGTDDILNNEPVNSCWGTILVQEKLEPGILCPPDMILTCNDPIDTSFTKPPILTTCESDVEIYYWDDVETFEECADIAAIITRTWYVEDGEGNRSSCEQILTILPGMMEMIDWPDHTSFNDPYACPTTGADVPPSETGYPTINGKKLNESTYCNFFVNYTDEVYYGGCDGDFDIVRIWKVKNSCLPLGPDNPVKHYQNITIRDNQKPIVEGCPKDLTVSVDPWTCEANLELPLPDKVSDVCNDVTVHAKIFGGGRVIQEGSLKNGNLKLIASRLGIGEYKVVYDFIDVCGNKASCEYYLTVVDDVKPFAIAKEFTVASVIESDEEGNQIVKVFAESIDNGSWDACSELEYYVRRMDGDPHDCDTKDFFPYDYDDEEYTRAEAIAMYYDEVECRTAEAQDDFAVPVKFNPNGYDFGAEICNTGEIQYNGDEWGDFAKFCCDDFGSGEDADGDGYANEFRVELIVFDHYGNWNITWGWVKIEDPNPPTLVANPHYAYCHDEVLNGPISEAIESIAADANDPDLVYAYGICDIEYDVVQGEPYDIWYDPTCKYGSFKIPYQAANGKGVIVRNVQTVYIYYKDDFSCDNIYGWTLDEEDDWYDPEADNYDFRDNLSAECDPIAPPALSWDAGPCELIGYTLTSDTFYFETDACRKIINEWTVIDWCVYDAAEDDTKKDFLQEHWYEYQQIAAYWDDRGIDRNDARRDRRDDELLCNSNEYWVNIGDIHNPDYEPTTTSYDAFEVDGKFLDFMYEIEVPNWNKGIYKWSQIIKVSDDDAPVITPFENDMKLDTFLTECGINLRLELCATDMGDCPADWMKWELWQIDEIGGDIISDSYGLKTALCAVWTNIPGTNESKVTRYYRAKAWDGCGNVDIYDFTWKIEDKKAPTPYCINLSTALMADPDGDGYLVPMVELWACDFDESSFDNCPKNLLFFTFDGVPPAVDFKANKIYIYEYEQYYTADGLLMYYDDVDNNRWEDKDGIVVTSSAVKAIQDAYLTGDDGSYDGEIYRWQPAHDSECGKYTAGKVYTEDEMANGDTDGDGNVDVQMDVWDECLNVDFCSVELTLRCSDCDDDSPRASVAGIISTIDDREVSNVLVNIQALNNVVSAKTMMTAENGEYAFANNPMYLDYYVVARKEGDDDQGVSTLDLILIKRHILGLQLLDNPYLRIAADINYDKKISATDLIQLRKLILGIYTKFPQNESWRFVDSDQELLPETVLNEFRERRDIIDLSANQMSEDLVAIKIGDIDGDARVNARDNGLITRNLRNLVLSFNDQKVKKGDKVKVIFSGKDQADVFGMQFTLSLSNLKVEMVNGISFEMNGSNYSLSKDKMSVSLNKDEATSFEDELFEITFIAQEKGSISEMISIDGSVTSNEVYVGSDLEVYTLELGKEDNEVVFDLYQNEPNPFTNFTRIGFNMGESGETSIIIHDVTGKVIKTIRNNFKKGYNEVRLDKSELNVSGLLYYTLSSGEFTATRKMIII